MSLHEAISSNRIECVIERIAMGDDVNAPNDLSRTPLYQSCCRGFTACVHALIEARANVNATNQWGWTPLHGAAANGHGECMRLLLASKAMVDLTNIHGNTALHDAAYEGRWLCVEMLIKAKANVELRNMLGHTPLARAMKQNHPDCVDLLLSVGFAKLSSVPFENENCMRAISKKRRNVVRSMWAFIAVMRKRFTVPCAGTLLIGNRIPRDVVTLLSMYLWMTRLDSRWANAAFDDIQQKKKCILM